MVTLVLGGDGIKTIDQVKEALDKHRPVVIVKDSSRVPTLLAELFYVLEDKVPRSFLRPLDYILAPVGNLGLCAVVDFTNSHSWFWLESKLSHSVDYNVLQATYSAK